MALEIGLGMELGTNLSIGLDMGLCMGLDMGWEWAKYGVRGMGLRMRWGRWDGPGDGVRDGAENGTFIRLKMGLRCS